MQIATELSARSKVMNISWGFIASTGLTTYRHLHSEEEEAC
jgi:hypothetical protein